MIHKTGMQRGTQSIRHGIIPVCLAVGEFISRENLVKSKSIVSFIVGMFYGLDELNNTMISTTLLHFDAQSQQRRAVAVKLSGFERKNLN